MKKILLLKEINLNLDELKAIKIKLDKIKTEGDKYITEKQVIKLIGDVEECEKVLKFSKEIDNIESYESDIHDYSKYINRLKRFFKTINSNLVNS